MNKYIGSLFGHNQLRHKSVYNIHSVLAGPVTLVGEKNLPKAKERLRTKEGLMVMLLWATVGHVGERCLRVRRQEHAGSLVRKGLWTQRIGSRFVIG